MICHTAECHKAATMRVYWPGLNPPPVYCHDCCERALGILDAMGCKVMSEGIPMNGAVREVVDTYQQMLDEADVQIVKLESEIKADTRKMWWGFAVLGVCAIVWTIWWWT